MKASALGSFDISTASGAKTAIGDVADAIEIVKQGGKE